MHRVAIIILKAIFIGLGRDEKIIDEVDKFPPALQHLLCRLQRALC